MFNMVLLLLLGLVGALQVTPGSSCATFCLDHERTNAFDHRFSTTNSSDIACEDLDFSTEEKGIKFKACLECLAKSKKVDEEEEESDLHWYLCKSSAWFWSGQTLSTQRKTGD